nr:hypothetical protein [Tanacetum cinerariifolium]
AQIRRIFLDGYDILDVRTAWQGYTSPPLELRSNKFIKNIPEETLPHHVPQSSTNVIYAFVLDSNDLKDLVKTYRIPLDLYPRLPDLGFTMDHLPAGMSIYDFMTLPSWSEAKIVEESHHLSLPLLVRVPSHTTTSTTKGAIILLPTPDQIAASLPDSHLSKKSKGPSQASRPSKKRKLQKRASKAGSSAPELDQTESADEADLVDLCAEIEDSLERGEGISMRVVSAPTPCLGKRLGAPPPIAVVSASEPSYVGTSALASTSCRSLSLGDVVASGRVGKSGAEVMRRQMDLLDNLAQIDLTLFPLALGPYHMPYLYEGVSSPLYTKEEWDKTYVPDSNILCKDFFKDPEVCRKALDQTITRAELRRTKSLLPLELSNRMNVLSALLVSHGYELNSRYTNLVSSKALLHEKLNKKKGDVRDAASEDVKKLQSQLIDAKAASEVLTKELIRTDAKLSEQALTGGGCFVFGSGVEGVVRKLLSSDEFHAALARVASLGINYGVERRLRMGRTDVVFEAAVHKVSNFHAGAKADFDKALVDFPTTPFPFLNKIAAASGGTLSDVAQILPDKFVCSATSVFVAPSSVNEATEQVELSWEGEDFVLPPFHWQTYVFLSFALVVAYYFIRRFRFIPSASSFSLSDPWIVLLVGMPIFAGMSALVPYARLNGVSPLLVLGVVLIHSLMDCPATAAATATATATTATPTATTTATATTTTATAAVAAAAAPTLAAAPALAPDVVAAPAAATAVASATATTTTTSTSDATAAPPSTAPVAAPAAVALAANATTAAATTAAATATATATAATLSATAAAAAPAAAATPTATPSATATATATTAATTSTATAIATAAATATVATAPAPVVVASPTATATATPTTT